MFSNKAISLVFLAILALQTANEVKSSGTASWYYRGTVVTSNTSLSLNTGDSFLIKCKVAKGVAGSFSGLVVLMFASSSTASPSLSATVDLTPTSFTQATLSPSSGTIIYDTLSNTRTTWAHWNVAETWNYENSDYNQVYVTVYIPKLISTDAGTLYCVYAYDNNGNMPVTLTNYAFSNGFTLSLTTKSGAKSRNSNANRLLQYSAALLSSAKLIL